MLRTKRKKKYNSLKDSIIEEDVEEWNDSEEDEDLALITRKFKKFMKDEKYKGRRFTSTRDSQKKEASSNEEKMKNDLICCKFKKP